MQASELEPDPRLVKAVRPPESEQGGGANRHHGAAGTEDSPPLGGARLRPVGAPEGEPQAGREGQAVHQRLLRRQDGETEEGPGHGSRNPAPGPQVERGAADEESE